MVKIMISIIVPVYKVEKFIEKCATSLFCQTYSNIEYLFVDDATPDKSIVILKEVIKRFPDRQDKVRILTHKENKGLPAARNTGLCAAGGDYIFHCDSDDFLEPDAMEKLYEKAKENDADIVWCDWFLSFEKNERYMKQPEYDTVIEALKGLLCDTMKYNVWNKLVKRSIYVDNRIFFPSGHDMGEDMTMIKLFACADKVAYVPKACYHYKRINTDAFTRSFSDKNLHDIIFNTEQTVSFLEKKYGNLLKSEISYFKLNVKFPLLINDNYRLYRLWKELFSESDEYIGKNKNLSCRHRMLEYAASRGWFGIVWLHYNFVYKFIYGILYR